MCFIKPMQLYCNFIIINSVVSSKKKKTGYFQEPLVLPINHP